MVQVLLGTAAVVAVYLVLRSLVRESVAFLAALFIALNPHFIIYCAFPFRENLIIPLLVFFLMLLLPAIKKHSIRLFLACAFAYALLIHTDVRFLPLGLTLPFMVLAYHRSLKRAVAQTAWIYLFLFLLMIPYTIRGYAAFGRLIVVTERFLETNLPMMKNRFVAEKKDATTNKRLEWLREWETEKEMEKDKMKPVEKRYYESGGRPAVDRFGLYWFLFREYWRFARFQPEYRPYLDGRFAGPWSLKHNLASSLVVLPFFLFFPFVWFGSIKEEKRIALVLFLYLLSHMALHVLIHARERYRFPAEVIMAILLAIGLANAWTLWRGRRSRT
jgi:4-amino-4-deoxy-L-arabinose transferase-like glycosyltransferase